MKNEVNELQLYFCPFGYLDMKAVCKIGDEIWVHERELFEIIDDEKESFGYKNYENVDPVASVLDYIYHVSRNRIEELTGYDFLNDYSGSWNGIYTYGNYMCSSYDYCDEAREELAQKVRPCLEEIKKDKLCKYFLTELEIGVD